MSEETTVEPTEERWVFAGTRVMRDGKKCNTWLPEGKTDPDDEMLFTWRAGYGIGYVYVVTVKRAGDNVSLYNDPAPYFTGEKLDESERTRLYALHRAAEMQIDNTRREKAAQRDDALAEALRPIRELVWSVRAHRDRVALIQYIEGQLWREPKREGK